MTGEFADLLDGSTRGPVDLSVTVRLYLTELPLACIRLPDSPQVANLQARLAAAFNTAIGQGESVVEMRFSPAEQGYLMGVLGDATCRFSGGLRFRLQQAMVKMLVSVGSPTEL